MRMDWKALVRFSILNGVLFSIGTSWSTAIRQVSRLVLPEDTADAVLAELLAATLTTALGVGIALCVGRASHRAEEPLPPPPPQRRMHR